jgi:hypothetical protein
VIRFFSFSSLLYVSDKLLQEAESTVQSQKLSRWEVGIDFVFSIAINLGTQAIFLHSFTLQKGVGFTAVFLTLALLRRYLVRRGFNLLVAPGMGQSRQMSLVEATTDTVLAVAMAFGLVLLWYPGEPMPRISGLILASYVLTLARRYVIRRIFEWFAYVPSSYGS